MCMTNWSVEASSSTLPQLTSVTPSPLPAITQMQQVRLVRSFNLTFVPSVIVELKAKAQIWLVLACYIRCSETVHEHKKSLSVVTSRCSMYISLNVMYFHTKSVFDVKFNIHHLTTHSRHNPNPFLRIRFPLISSQRTSQGQCVHVNISEATLTCPRGCNLPLSKAHCVGVDI